MISPGACFGVIRVPNGAKSSPLSRRVSPCHHVKCDSMGMSASKTKENSFRAKSRLIQDCHLRHRFRIPAGRYRNVGRFPFPPFGRVPRRRGRHQAPGHFARRFTSGVRTDLPVSFYSSHGNLLRFSLQCSQLNIRYYNQDLHWKRAPPVLTPKASQQRSTPTYTTNGFEDQLAGVP